jgi:cytochrome c oxidase assembly protein subunit 15
MLAYLTGAVLITAAVRGLLTTTDRRLKLASVLMLTAVCLQIVLGISTVLTHVDITIAAGHQSGAVVLLTTVLFWVHVSLTQGAD